MTHISKKVSIAIMVAVFIVAMCFSVVILPSKAYAATPIYVDGSVAVSGDGTSWATAKKTITEGIVAVTPGGTVNVAAGTYYENLVIGKSLSLVGAGAGSTIINGRGINSVITISDSNCTIDGFTITNGRSGGGGGIYNEFGTLTVTNSTISGNTAYYGGGILTEGGTLTVTNTTISGNTASNSGGGIYNAGGTLTVTNTTISGNTASNLGGGIYIESYRTLTVTNTTISSNTAPNGGGIFINRGTVEATHNWWGASSGPSGGVTDPVTGEIADGAGDGIRVITGSISFDPWYIDAAMTTLSNYVAPIAPSPVEEEEEEAKPKPKEAKPKPKPWEITDIGFYEKTDTGFITLFYSRFFSRPPDQAGLDSWVAWLESGAITGADLAKGFIFSEENQARISDYTNEEFITFLYRVLFNRAPEEYSFNAWLARMSAGMTKEEVVDGFTHSEEFVNLCKEFGIIPYEGYIDTRVIF